MLQQMRSGAASWVAKGLMILLVISFGAWGIGDYIGNFGSNDPVAEVGDAEIGQLEFADAWRREVAGLQRRFGGNFSAEQALQLGLDETVLNRLIEEQLYRQAAREIGVTITEEDVRQAIMAAPAFRGPTGQFDRFAFENYLRNEGYSEAMLVNVLRQELARTRLLGSLFGSMAAAPDIMVDRVLGYRLERRLAEYAVVDASRLPEPPAPGDQQIEEYYKANPAAFTAPERRSVAWFQILPADRASSVEISEDELRDEYEAHRAAYVTPERRSVEQVVFTTEAQAKEAYEAVSKGEDFLAMAARTQKLKPEDVKLGMVTRDDLPATIANAVFALEPNRVGEPVTSPFGWHVVRVTAVEPGSTKSFEEAKAELHQQLATAKATEGMMALRAQIDDQIAGGAAIEEIAKAQNATLHVAEDIDAQGQKADGKPAENLPQEPDFLNRTFDTDTDAEPQIVDLAGGGLIVLKVNGIEPAAVKPLETVKADVIAALQQRARADAAAERARQIAERVRNGGDLAKEAADLGAQVQLSAPLNRTGQPAERAFSSVVVSALFNAKQPGEVVTGPAANLPGVAPNSAIVARLSRIEPADPAAVARQREQTAQQLAAGMVQDLVQQYRQTLQKEFGVKVDPAARARAAGL